MCLTLTEMNFFNFLDVCLHYVKNEKEKSVEKYLEKLKRSVLITNDAELF